MNTSEDKVVCETPTPGKSPTRIDRWKYELIREAILKVLPSSGDGDAFKDLARLVSRTIDGGTRERIGSLGWYTTTVKLDLECRGLIRRIAGSRPQRLLRSIESPRQGSGSRDP